MTSLKPLILGKVLYHIVSVSFNKAIYFFGGNIGGNEIKEQNLLFLLKGLI